MRDWFRCWQRVNCSKAYLDWVRSDESDSFELRADDGRCCGRLEKEVLPGGGVAVQETFAMLPVDIWDPQTSAFIREDRACRLIAKDIKHVNQRQLVESLESDVVETVSDAVRHASRQECEDADALVCREAESAARMHFIKDEDFWPLQSEYWESVFLPCFGDLEPDILVEAVRDYASVVQSLADKWSHWTSFAEDMDNRTALLRAIRFDMIAEEAMRQARLDANHPWRKVRRVYKLAGVPGEIRLCVTCEMDDGTLSRSRITPQEFRMQLLSGHGPFQADRIRAIEYRGDTLYPTKPKPLNVAARADLKSTMPSRELQDDGWAEAPTGTASDLRRWLRGNGVYFRLSPNGKAQRLLKRETNGSEEILREVCLVADGTETAGRIVLYYHWATDQVHDVASTWGKLHKLNDLSLSKVRKKAIEDATLRLLGICRDIAATLPADPAPEMTLELEDIVRRNLDKSAEQSAKEQIRQWLRQYTPAFRSKDVLSSPDYAQEISGRLAEQMRDAAPTVLQLAAGLLRYDDRLQKSI